MNRKSIDPFEVRQIFLNLLNQNASIRRQNQLYSSAKNNSNTLFAPHTNEVHENNIIKYSYLFHQNSTDVNVRRSKRSTLGNTILQIFNVVNDGSIKIKTYVPATEYQNDIVISAKNLLIKEFGEITIEQFSRKETFLTCLILNLPKANGSTATKKRLNTEYLMSCILFDLCDKNFSRILLATTLTILRNCGLATLLIAHIRTIIMEKSQNALNQVSREFHFVTK